MNDLELSARFEVLYNNITSNQSPGVNIYERSVFLTKAQDEVVKNYFNPKGNKYSEGFDGSQKRQIDFSTITTVEGITVFYPSLYDNRDNSKSVALPDDVWMIVNERAEVLRNNKDVGLVVKAISYDDYDNQMSKPFKRPLNHQAWRLINNRESNKADLIVGPVDTLKKYVIRYIKRPTPIIVGSLDGLTINGYCYTGDREMFGLDANVPETAGCCLDPILHEEIVQRAVELAKTAWTSTGQDNMQPFIQAGQRSE